MPPINPPPPIGVEPSLLTSTGGLLGNYNILISPFYDTRTGKSYFIYYDPTNFDCENDCTYNFRLEDVATGRNIDVHKVYLQYRGLGPVTFSVTVTATQYDKQTKVETTNSVTVSVSLTASDNKIHSYFVDLKVVGERPFLSIFRAANMGPLSIIKAMLIGHSSEGEQI